VSIVESISAICTSNGKSMSTGPGRAEPLKWNACWKARGSLRRLPTVTDHLVTGFGDGLDVHRLEVLFVTAARAAPVP